MKLRRTMLSLLLLLAGAQLSMAQYSGEVRKPQIPVAQYDSLLQFTHKGNYQAFDREVGNLYEFTPYDPLHIKPADAVKLPFFHASIGMQVPVMPSVEISLNKAFSNKFTMGVDACHNSFFGNLPAVGGISDLNERISDCGIGGSLKIGWNDGEFHLGMRYDTERRSYDTNETATGVTHSDGVFNLNAGVCSTKANENNLYYKFDIDFSSLASNCASSLSDSRLSLSENDVTVSGYVGTTFDVHRLYIDMNMEIASNTGAKDYTTMIVEFSPFYEYKNGRFAGKFGVKFGNRFGLLGVNQTTKMPDGNDLSAVSTIFPNVDARVEIVRNSLWARLLVNGGYDMNSFASLHSACPLLSPSTPMRMGSRPMDAVLSLESIVSGRFAVNVSGRYTLNRDKAVFSPVVDESVEASCGLYPIMAWDMDVNTFTLSAEAFWKSSSFTMGGEVCYNSYWSLDASPITELPKFNARAYLRYSWRERIVFSADFNYRSPTSGEKWGHYEVPSITDLNLSLKYAFNRHLALFAKCGNLLNSANQYVPCYVEPGRSFGGGITLDF